MISRVVVRVREKGGRFPGERANLSGRKVPGFSEKGLTFLGPNRMVTLTSAFCKQVQNYHFAKAHWRVMAG